MGHDAAAAASDLSSSLSFQIRIFSWQPDAMQWNDLQQQTDHSVQLSATTRTTTTKNGWRQDWQQRGRAACRHWIARLCTHGQVLTTAERRGRGSGGSGGHRPIFGAQSRQRTGLPAPSLCLSSILALHDRASSLYSQICRQTTGLKATG